MDTSQYLELFIDETQEHLQSLNEHILELEKEPEDTDTINEIFRAAHTLKGMAGTMGYTRMQRLTHDLENVFQEIRNGNMKANAKLIDILFRGLDALEGYLEIISTTGSEGTEDNEDIIKDLDELVKEGTGKASDGDTKEEKAKRRRHRHSRLVQIKINSVVSRFLSMKSWRWIMPNRKVRIFLESQSICRNPVF